MQEKKVPHPKIFLLSTRYRKIHYEPTFLRELRREKLIHVLCYGYKSWNLEILNYDVQGSVVNCDSEGKFIRLPLEYEPTYVYLYHQVMTVFLKWLKESKVNVTEAATRLASKHFPFHFYRDLIEYLVPFTLYPPHITLKIPFLKHHPKEGPPAKVVSFSLPVPSDGEK
jgi:hypothetical protein